MDMSLCHSLPEVRLTPRLLTYFILRSEYACVCRDGYGATSVFCTLMALLEQLQAEKAVDVFQAAHRLRMINPNMMYSLVSSCQSDS